MKKRRFFRRALAIAVLTTLASANAFGLSTKYFNTVAQSNTGEGTVYASMDYKKPADSGFSTESSTGAKQDSVSYVFAKPATGYGFKEWQLVSGDLAQSSFDLSANPMMVVNNGSSTSSSSPATITLKAVFVPAAVSVISDNEEFGTVSIDIPANALGQKVTLTARPDSTTFKFSEFEGWYLNGVKQPNMGKTAELTISESNSGVYVAKFTRKAGYFRLKSQVASKYTYVFGDSARQSNSSTEGFSGIVFDGSIAMVPAANLDLTDPGYIVKIDGVTDLKNGGLKDLDFTSQGVNARNMITEKYPTAIVNARASGDYWTFYYNYGGNDRYLKDGTYYPINYAIACGGASDHLWTLEPVDEEDNYFGVTPDFNIGQKYYTTLYTDFPYECLGGVTAYIVNNQLDTIHIGKYVPANTPVILQCTSATASNNKLKPIFECPSVDTSANYLKGFISLNGSVLEANENYWILDNVSGNLSFSEYTGGLHSNKAYIDFTNYPNLARSLNSTTGIRENKVNFDDNTVYDLMGRKFEPNSANKKGIYVINGKKMIIR